MKYRLEYKERKNQFRLGNYSHEENTFGWETVLESITDLEFKIIKIYLNNSFGTFNEVCEKIEELSSFHKRLINNNLDIKQ